MTDENNNPLLYYARPGVMTDPGPYALLFDDLPHEIPALCKIVQSNMIHVFWAERYGVNLSETRQQALQKRAVAQKLALLQELDNRPLAVTRPAELRLAGNCRDFSTLLCAILRHQGVPARARCGFGVYFLPDHFEDHWVCEYWQADAALPGGGRWIMVDAQLDELQRKVLEIKFDSCDVPVDQFLVAGKAWQMCRQGQADPDQFGIFDMHGLEFIRGNVVRDFLALNKVEILPWDWGWGFLAEPSTTLDPQEVDQVFDRVASLTQQGNEAFTELRSVYQSDPRWPVPEAWIEQASEDLGEMV